jgi:heme-degrading monooxygenase HmoA
MGGRIAVLTQPKRQRSAMKTIEERPDSPDTQPASSRRRLLEGSLFGALTLAAHSALAQRSPRNSQVDITIHANGQMVTLVNVCTVDPRDQQELIDIFKEGTEAWISKVPGYISTSLHKSTDGRRVVIYSQWQNAQSIGAMRDSAEMGPYMNRIKALATPDSTICEVIYARHV